MGEPWKVARKAATVEVFGHCARHITRKSPPLRRRPALRRAGMPMLARLMHRAQIF